MSGWTAVLFKFVLPALALLVLCESAPGSLKNFFAKNVVTQFYTHSKTDFFQFFLWQQQLCGDTTREASAILWQQLVAYPSSQTQHFRASADCYTIARFADEVRQFATCLSYCLVLRIFLPHLCHTYSIPWWELQAGLVRLLLREQDFSTNAVLTMQCCEVDWFELLIIFKTVRFSFRLLRCLQS